MPIKEVLKLKITAEVTEAGGSSVILQNLEYSAPSDALAHAVKPMGESLIFGLTVSLSGHLLSSDKSKKEDKASST